jgi:hypothetical protein
MHTCATRLCCACACLKRGRGLSSRHGVMLMLRRLVCVWLSAGAKRKCELACVLGCVLALMFVTMRGPVLTLLLGHVQMCVCVRIAVVCGRAWSRAAASFCSASLPSSWQTAR